MLRDPRHIHATRSAVSPLREDGNGSMRHIIIALIALAGSLFVAASRAHGFY
jgi:hypothetical protein